MYKNGKPHYNEVVFNENQVMDIINSYRNNESSVSIGKRYGVGHHIILKVLHKNNIEIDRKKFIRKYKLDEHYFDIIDTPTKAYILGLFYSDGNNNPSKSTLSISLQEEDKYILETIRVRLKSEKPLEFINNSNKHTYGYNYKNQYRLLFFSSYLCKRLSELGVVENKSLVLTFPEFLPDYLISHFVRGVYDGDGSIYCYHKNENNHQVTVTITSTANFCKTLQNVCKGKLGISGNIYDASCHNGITKVFTLSGRNISQVFLKWIYEDANMFLIRKYNRYLDYYKINNSLLK